MSGNVWEWTRSIIGRWDSKKSTHVDMFVYPYESTDGREDLQKPDEFSRSLRGGSFDNSGVGARCACRDLYVPDLRYRRDGFRVMLSPLLLSQP